MARRLRLWLPILLAFAGCVALPSFAAAQPPSFSIPLFSDFDGDSKVDQAELVSNGAQKHIHVSFGSLNWKSLSFDSGVQDRGRLVSDDIDRDGDTDIVWISQGLPRTYVLWLGDGRGNFSLAAADERKHLEPFLSGESQTHVGGNTDDGEQDGVLQEAPLVALESASSASHETTSQRSLGLTSQVFYASICLSALWKRGPPSRLS
jgi:hypothetical protein